MLVRYVGLARELGAGEVIVVGTEPLRVAADADWVTREVEPAIGTRFQVLDHDDEGFLTLIGVTGGRRSRVEMVVADVGGGSTELVVTGPRRRPTATGLRLGSARLTARFVSHDPPTRNEVKALRRAARTELAASPDATPEEIVGVGGTASNLVKIIPPAALADPTLTSAMIDEAFALLLEHSTAVVSDVYGVKPARAAILPAGAAIMGAILERYESDRMTVIDTGIREGLVHVASRAGDGWREHLAELSAGWRD